MNNEELVAKALQARHNAYAPYSKFRVGAALLCEDGTVFCGVNVENASYGGTICAERTAVCAAAASGRRSFIKIAVASDSEAPCIPCGMCLQVLAEFSPGMSVLCAGRDGHYEEYSFRELLPKSFRL